MMSSHGVTPAWIVRARAKASPSLRLFCLSYAGGGASVYRRWAEELETNIDVCAVQLPGRERRLREPPFTRLTDLVPACAQGMAPYLERPFAFFGHSMGALVAFELARHLRSRYGVTPVHLAVSGLRAPQTAPRYQPVHQLPDDALVEEVRRRWDGIPAAVLAEPELMEIFLPTLRADLSVVETYAYRDADPFDCPISCFGGLDDQSVDRADLDAWRDQTRGPFRLRMLPGNHFFLQTARDPLVRALSEDLARRQEGPR